MIKLFNAIPAGDACGWGVCGMQLERHLPNHCEVVTDIRDADALLCPVDNNMWGYGHQGSISSIAHALGEGIPVIGYGFHEFDIAGTQTIKRLPFNYTALACGSTWMAGWVKRALQGVADDFPVEVVLQGVDHDLFTFNEQEKPDFMKDRFVVASAGKFEYRKAQDVVIEIFRRFKKSVPEAMLMLAWDNPWPESMLTMNASTLPIDMELKSVNNQIYIAGVGRELIKPDDQVTWQACNHVNMPFFYQNADAAIFPNRCEAGNNNCMVEAVSCGIPSVILDDHGHEDIVEMLTDSPCVFMSHGKSFRYSVNGNDVANWIEPCIEEGLSDLMRVYREAATSQEKQVLSAMTNSLTWDKTAADLVKLCEKVVK